jgi:hypothetical protein
LAAKRTTAQPDTVHGEGSEPVQEASVVEIKPVDGLLEITVSTGFQVNLGNFEHKSMFGSAKGKFTVSDKVEDVAEYLWNRVYDTLAPELQQAADLTTQSSKVRGEKTGTFIYLLVSDE